MKYLDGLRFVWPLAKNNSHSIPAVSLLGVGKASLLLSRDTHRDQEILGMNSIKFKFFMWILLINLLCSFFFFLLFIRNKVANICLFV